MMRLPGCFEPVKMVQVIHVVWGHRIGMHTIRCLSPFKGAEQLTGGATATFTVWQGWRGGVEGDHQIGAE